MSLRINYMLKVYDAKLVEIKKALESANIKIHSILEAHREEVENIAEEKRHKKYPFKRGIFYF